MSKKSRRRNRRLLGALAALGGAAMLANRRRNASIADNEAKEAGFDVKKTIMDNMPKNIDKKILDVPVSTPKTIMDNMPKRPKLNEKSIRIKDNTNKIYTIEDAKKGIPPRVGNEKSIFIGKDGYIRQGKDATPMTPGRFGTYKAAQEMKKGMLPPQLRVPEVRTPITYGTGNDGLSYGLKSGGRVVKTGEKVAKRKKKKSIQIKGFGKARRG